MGKNRDGAQQGETGHAEGQHGDKTHKAFIDQVESGADKASRANAAPEELKAGHHRLQENREQHDEADKKSEANRKRQEVDKGRLDPDLPGVADRTNGDPS